MEEVLICNYITLIWSSSRSRGGPPGGPDPPFPWEATFFVVSPDFRGWTPLLQRETPFKCFSTGQTPLFLVLEMKVLLYSFLTDMVYSLLFIKFSKCTMCDIVSYRPNSSLTKHSSIDINKENNLSMYMILFFIHHTFHRICDKILIYWYIHI